MLFTFEWIFPFAVLPVTHVFPACRTTSQRTTDPVSTRLFLWRRLRTLESTANSQCTQTLTHTLSIIPLSLTHSPTLPHPLTHSPSLTHPHLHWCRYYSLEVSYFKSSLDSHLLDLLWNKYWVNTLSSCSMITVSLPMAVPPVLLPAAIQYWPHLVLGLCELQWYIC